ncbi:MAG TPA: dihydrolipoyl dehydrogenase [Gemmataceae bacterium]|nr:dihydrolipoyl dehydrogenase [Gemmataceae bacterium]
MADTIESELVVLGAGPGGYGAAFLAADKGMKVTLIDAGEKPGGTCLHVGCIPSKALLHTAKLITDVRDAAHFGLDFGPPKIDLGGVRGQWQKVVATLSTNLLGLCKSRKVEFVHARARFADSRTVQLDDGRRLAFRNCIVATGSLPVKPPALALDSPRVMDSTAALRLEELPASLLVVGGGYIGLELGYVYAALGSKVTVVELTPSLLPGVDSDLVQPLQKRLKGLFHKIYLNTKVVRLSAAANGVKVVLEGEEVEDREPTFERVLIAVGRRPNSRDLGLENTKVQLDEKGVVKVDGQRRTTDEAIWAVGDVAGEPMLAHKATYEGKVAVEAIAGEPAVYDVRAVPAVVFTDPEIAWCGVTQTEAKKQGREVKVERFPWAASGRAATLGRTEGVTKLIVDPETDVVLGVGICGVGAGELIGEGVLAVEMAASARDLAMSMHPHPTLTETLMEDAELLHGSATHYYKPPRK